jgi:ATP-dependent Clp protease ATP-binding subunit ClpA
MFERFTDKARAVVVSAQDEARLLGHDYIGTEHLLLGLFDVPEGVAARALFRLGLSQEIVREDVEEMIGRGKGTAKGHIPFTPRAKKVLELALREALQLKHNYIGTEHIVLALVREGEGVAAKIMAERIDDLRRVKPTVLAVLGSASESEPEPVRARISKKATAAAEEAAAAAEALAGAAPIGSHHLLEALVRAEGSMAARVLDALGVDPETIAAKIDELDLEGTTDATPEEAAARKMELRVEGDEVQLVFRDAGMIELAGKVLELSGGAITGTGPVSWAFIPLWTSTNEQLRKFADFLEPESEDEPKDLLAKATLMMRRVMRTRLQRRPPDASAE